MLAIRNKRFINLVIMGFVLVGVSAATLSKFSPYSRFDLRYYLTKEKADFIRPGLNLEVVDLSVEDRAVSVTVRLTDDLGGPLDSNGVVTPGPMSASVVLGYIPQGETQYVALTTRVQTSPITNVSATQPSAESVQLEPTEQAGVYRMTANTLIPEDADPDATHSLGFYLTRDLRDFDLDRLVVNEVLHFTPSGGEVSFIRDIAHTDSCNKCHDQLALHGGARKDVDLCIMCHTAGVIDPDTGNSVDFDVMIHKIHMGESLPSVEAGEPYQIVGFRQSVHDYSNVVFPQDVRNCVSCHPSDAGQSMAHLLNPNRESCGSCHDDVNFVTGENHADLPQVSDNLCANCHIPQGELEFDASILGAHTIPENSEQLAGIHMDIQSISNTGPGEFPTVHFNITNSAGEEIEPESLTIRFLIAGPNTDYSFLARESANDSSVRDESSWVYTFNTAIPEDASGSFTLGAEAYRNAVLNAGTTTETTIRETMQDNPTLAFSVTDATPVPRRSIVSVDSCNDCHSNLSLHGGIRHDTDYCVMCHQPGADDSDVRPEDAGPARTIDFKMLVHRIHAGHELEDDYTVYGFRGSVHNYNEVLFPGNLANCENCHVSNSFDVPSGGVESTNTLNEFYSPMPPNSTACVGCHDSVGAAAHTFINTAPFGESCDVCHGPGTDYDVGRVHAGQ
jgi:OmcA/MtrC family decaheme c-type cytochrome